MLTFLSSWMRKLYKNKYKYNILGDSPNVLVIKSKYFLIEAKQGLDGLFLQLTS